MLNELPEYERFGSEYEQVAVRVHIPDLVMDRYMRGQLPDNVMKRCLAHIEKCPACSELERGFRTLLGMDSQGETGISGDQVSQMARVKAGILSKLNETISSNDGVAGWGPFFLDRTYRRRAIASDQGHNWMVFGYELSEEPLYVRLGPDDSSTADILSLPYGLDRVASAAIANDMDVVVLGMKDSSVRILALHTWKELHKFQGHSHEITAVCITEDGRMALSGDNHGNCVAWDTYTGARLFTLRGHTQPITRIVAITSRNLVVTASADATVKIWGLQDGRELGILRGHTGAVNDVAVIEDGSRLLTIANDGSARIWDLATYREKRCWTCDAGEILVLDVDEGKGLAACGTAGGAVAIWYLTSVDPLHVVYVDSARVAQVRFCRAGTCLCADYDNNVSLRLDLRYSTLSVPFLPGDLCVIRRAEDLIDKTRVLGSNNAYGYEEENK